MLVRAAYVLVFILFVIFDWIGSFADWLEEKKDQLEEAIHHGQESEREREKD